MSLIYVPMGGKIVVCPDAGCVGCEHGDPHEWDTVDSSCNGGGDWNCPACVLVEELTAAAFIRDQAQAKLECILKWG